MGSLLVAGTPLHRFQLVRRTCSVVPKRWFRLILVQRLKHQIQLQQKPKEKSQQVLVRFQWILLICKLA